MCCTASPVEGTRIGVFKLGVMARKQDYSIADFSTNTLHSTANRSKLRWNITISIWN